MTYDEAHQLQKVFGELAAAESSWRALALVGSWARSEAREDSDLDLIALVDHLPRWTTNDEWLRGVVGQLGFRAPLISLEVYGVAKSWRALLESGAELELTLAELNWASTQPLDSGTKRVVSDGMQPLIDKDGLLQKLKIAVLSNT